MMDTIGSSEIAIGFDNAVIFIRMAERVLLTLFFVVTATVIMVAYRKKIQNIDLNLATEAGSVKTTTSIVMPVFILLTIILFTYVVLMSPIRFESTGQGDPQVDPSTLGSQTKGSVFVGYGPGTAAQQRLARDLLQVVAASSSLRSATDALSEAQRGAFTASVDDLGQSAGRLQAMLFAILSERFPGREDCYPNVLTGFESSPASNCDEVNNFLFFE